MDADFKAWIDRVNMVLAKLAGIQLEDLPDCCYADWYEKGMAPAAAARKAVREAGF